RAMLAAPRDDPGLIQAVLPAAQQALTSGRQLHPQLRYLIAVLAARAHQLTEAEFFFRRSLEGGRRNQQREAAAYSGLIRVLWLARKYEALAEVCRQGLRQAQATNHLLFHQYLSRALVLLGQADEAVAEADKAVDI